jgi:DNA-directed RNA polymerase II subunit RPB2
MTSVGNDRTSLVQLEMEQQCMLSHGASMFLKEKMLINSDEYKTHICKDCGLIASANTKKNIYECKHCKTSEISKITIPYATKLLFQELMSMQITPKLNLKEKN